MNIDKRWLTAHLTEDELMMFFNIAMHNSQYKQFDLDTIQAVRPAIFARNFQQVRSIVNEQGNAVLESLRNKLLEIQNSYIQ
jgi:hypothetical protein